MVTSYPTGLDSFTNPAPSDLLSTEVGTRTHSEFHADINDAMEAVQAELGVAPSGDSATVAARFVAIRESSLRVPAGLCGIIAGAPSYSTVSTRQWGWLLDDATSEAVVTPLLRIPSHWSSMDVDVVFSPQSTGAGNIRWATRVTQISAGDTVSTTDSGDETQATGAATDQHVLGVTEIRSAVSVDPTKWMRVWVGRIGGNAADTQTGDVGLLEIALRDATA